MNPIYFQAIPTPNPKSYKFQANRQLHDGPAQAFYTPEDARKDAIAAKVFAIPGVIGFMLLGDFCSVNQDGSRNWSELVPEIEAVLTREFNRVRC